MCTAVWDKHGGLFGRTLDLEYTYDEQVAVTPRGLSNNRYAIIGTATVLYNGEAVGTVDLVAREAVDFSEFAFLMENLKILLTSAVAKIIYVLILLFALFYIYYIFVLVPKARKRQQARRARQQAQQKKQDR